MHITHSLTNLRLNRHAIDAPPRSSKKLILTLDASYLQVPVNRRTWKSRSMRWAPYSALKIQLRLSVLPRICVRAVLSLKVQVRLGESGHRPGSDAMQIKGISQVRPTLPQMGCARTQPQVRKVGTLLIPVQDTAQRFEIGNIKPWIP